MREATLADIFQAVADIGLERRDPVITNESQHLLQHRALHRLKFIEADRLLERSGEEGFLD